MQKPILPENCPDSWKLSFQYDEMEVFGNKTYPGYYYAYQNRFNTLLNAVKKYLPQQSTILDLAAASGNITLALAEDGYKMIWNDLRAELAAYVQMKHTKGDVTYVPGNIFELQQDAVDAVIISEIIEHVAHPDDFLQKVSTLVKPGGYVFLSTPLGSYFLNTLPRFSTFAHPEIFEERQFMPNSDGHIFLLHADEIEVLGRAAGLSVQQSFLNNNPLSSGHLKMHYLLKMLPEKWVKLLESISKKLPFALAKFLHANIIVVLKKG